MSLCKCKQENFLKLTEEAVLLSMSISHYHQMMNEARAAIDAEPCTCQEKKEEPKPECDHIVGKINFSEDHLYEQSWSELKEFFIERAIKWHLVDMNNIRLIWQGQISSDFVPFDYCHLCGEKIDLQAVIESTKKLNLITNE